MLVYVLLAKVLAMKTTSFKKKETVFFDCGHPFFWRIGAGVTSVKRTATSSIMCSSSFSFQSLAWVVSIASSSSSSVGSSRCVGNPDRAVDLRRLLRVPRSLPEPDNDCACLAWSRFVASASSYLSSSSRISSAMVICAECVECVRGRGSDVEARTSAKALAESMGKPKKQRFGVASDGPAVWPNRPQRTFRGVVDFAGGCASSDTRRARDDAASRSTSISRQAPGSAPHNVRFDWHCWHLPKKKTRRRKEEKNVPPSDRSPNKVLRYNAHHSIRWSGECSHHP